MPMKKVKLYTKEYCPYCVRAKTLLNSKNVEFEEINIEGQTSLSEGLFQKTGFRTVPQIFIGEECIGGYSQLAQLEQSGELDQKLKET